MPETQLIGGGHAQPHLSVFEADETTIESQFKRMTSSTEAALVRAQTELSTKLYAGGLNFEGKSYPVSIRPLLLDRAWAEQLADIAEQFSRLFDLAARLYVENLDVRRFFPAYRNVEHYAIRWPDHSPLVRVYRLDGLFDHAGSFRVLETNTDCPGGVIQNGLAARIWSEVSNPLLRSIRHTASFQPFVVNPDMFLQELCRAHQERTGSAPQRAAIVTFRGRFRNEVSQMVEGLNRLGVPTATVDAAELRREGHAIVDPQGRKIDLAYNKLDLRDLVDEPVVADYLEAAAAGEVTFLNPLVAQWPLADKAILAVLSDPRMLGRFPIEQQRLCRAHIPWTRMVQNDLTTGPDGSRIDLIEFVSTNRPALVLKPSNATRGEGLLVGPFTNDREWEGTITDILANQKPYVVQEYIRGRRLSAVHSSDGVVSPLWSGLDTYVYGGKFAGFQARASFDPVMNVGRRGILLPVVVREE
jgi:hypothetical protein